MNKKGVSIIIGYVLLVVITLVTGTVVYKTVETYISEDLPECSDEVSILIKSTEYIPDQLNVTLINDGLFDIAGYFIYGTTEPSQELATKDLSPFLKKQGTTVANNIVLFTGETNQMKPNDKRTSSFQLDEKIYSIEITPVRFQEEEGKETFVSCGKSKTNADLKMECGVCGTYSVCSEGTCVCDTDYANCDSNFVNGCECDTSGTNVCFGGSCCTPDTCDSLGYECGTYSDGCGNEIICGTCPFGDCEEGICVSDYWIKMLGGDLLDRASSIQQTADGGYIVAGKTDSFGAGENDILITNLDNNGNVNWTKTIGGEYSDTASSIQQTTDEKYIVVGETENFGVEGSDILFTKLYSNGTVDWAKAIGGEDLESVSSIQETDDAGYIIVGRTSFSYYSDDDPLIIKVNSNGDIVWAKTIGKGDSENVWAVQQTNDGEYIVVGKNEIDDPEFSFIKYGNISITKLHSNGEVNWAKTIDIGDLDVPLAIQQTSDGGYIVVGYSLNRPSVYSSSTRAFVLKLYSTGQIEWAKRIGGSDSIIYSVLQTEDEEYIIAGKTDSFGAGNYDGLFAKLDSNGEVLWTKTIGGENNDVINSIKQITNDEYILIGDTYSFGAGNYDAFIAKLDSNGEVSGCSNIQTQSMSSELFSTESQTQYINSVTQSFTSQPLSIDSVSQTLTETQQC